MLKAISGPLHSGLRFHLPGHLITNLKCVFVLILLRQGQPVKDPAEILNKVDIPVQRKGVRIMIGV